MTKAEKIFKDTRSECKMHIDVWGYETNPNGEAIGFNNVITDDVVCVRTINDLKKLLKSKRNYIDIDLRLGVIDEAKADKERKILNMVESTINNAKKLVA